MFLSAATLFRLRVRVGIRAKVMLRVRVRYRLVRNGGFWESSQLGLVLVLDLHFRVRVRFLHAWRLPAEGGCARMPHSATARAH